MEVQRLPLADCGRYGDSCRECILSRDPYCGWDRARRKCIAIPPGYNVTTGYDYHAAVNKEITVHVLTDSHQPGGDEAVKKRRLTLFHFRFLWFECILSLKMTSCSDDSDTVECFHLLRGKLFQAANVFSHYFPTGRSFRTWTIQTPLSVGKLLVSPYLLSPTLSVS